MLKDYFCMAFRNVRRGKSRSFLTALAIAIGIAAVVLLTAIGESGKALIHDGLESMGIRGIMVFSGDTAPLTVTDGERLCARIPEVSSFMPFETCISACSVYGNRSETCILLGVDQQLDQYMSMELLHGRLFTAAECSNGSPVCVVGADFARKLFGRENIVGKRIALTVDNVAEEYQVVGVVHSTLNRLSGMLGFQIPSFLYVPYSAVTTDGVVSQLAVQIDGKDLDTTVEKIQALLRRTHHRGSGFQVENLSGYMEEFDTILTLVTRVLSATAAISLFVAGIGIMNAMLATVSDRRSEIGICKAIGASSWQIALTFLLETLIVTGFGGGLGLGIGLLVAGIAFSSIGIPLTFNVYSILLPCVVTLIVGLVFGILPAVSAARLQPIVAIRKE